LINPKTKEVKDIDMDFKKNQSNDNTFRLRTNKITLMNKSSCSNMRMIDREKTCCRKVNQSEGRYVYNVKCAALIQITVLFIVGNIPR
jgi:hypothetical protein